MRPPRLRPLTILLLAGLTVPAALTGCSPPAADPVNEKPHDFARSFPFGFTPGERYTYSLVVTPAEREPGTEGEPVGAREGSIDLALDSAGGANLTLSYQVRLAGEEASGSVTARYDDMFFAFNAERPAGLTRVLRETVMSMVWLLYFTEVDLAPDAEWEIYTDVCCGGCLLEFTVEGETTIAGFHGFRGSWIAGGVDRGRFCISPEVPVPLSVTLFTLVETYEATLVAAEGLD